MQVSNCTTFLLYKDTKIPILNWYYDNKDILYLTFGDGYTVDPNTYKFTYSKIEANLDTEESPIKYQITKNNLDNAGLYLANLFILDEEKYSELPNISISWTIRTPKTHCEIERLKNIETILPTFYPGYKILKSSDFLIITDEPIIKLRQDKISISSLLGVFWRIYDLQKLGFLHRNINPSNIRFKKIPDIGVQVFTDSDLFSDSVNIKVPSDELVDLTHPQNPNPNKGFYRDIPEYLECITGFTNIAKFKDSGNVKFALEHLPVLGECDFSSYDLQEFGFRCRLIDYWDALQSFILVSRYPTPDFLVKASKYIGDLIEKYIINWMPIKKCELSKWPEFYVFWIFKEFMIYKDPITMVNYEKTN